MKASKGRRAFTLTEAIIAGAIFLMVAGILIYVFVHSRKVQASVSLHVTLLENVTLALHALRADIRHLALVPNEPNKPPRALDKFSFKTFDSDHGIMLKVSSSEPVNPAVVGSHYLIVGYYLRPTDENPNRFHLARTEFTASGTRNIPGKSTPIETRVFRTFTLNKPDTTFYYLTETLASGTETHLLHVAMDVVSDTGPTPDEGPFKEKHLVVTNVIRLVQPETPYDPMALRNLADRISCPLIPPDEVRAPPANVAELQPSAIGF